LSSTFLVIFGASVVLIGIAITAAPVVPALGNFFQHLTGLDDDRLIYGAIAFMGGVIIVLMSIIGNPESNRREETIQE